MINEQLLLLSEDEQVDMEIADLLRSDGLSEKEIGQILWELNHPEEFKAMQLQRWRNFLKNMFGTYPLK